MAIARLSLGSLSAVSFMAFFGFGAPLSLSQSAPKLNFVCSSSARFSLRGHCARTVQRYKMQSTSYACACAPRTFGAHEPQGLRCAATPAIAFGCCCGCPTRGDSHAYRDRVNAPSVWWKAPCCLTVRFTRVATNQRTVVCYAGHQRLCWTPAPLFFGSTWRHASGK